MRKILILILSLSTFFSCFSYALASSKGKVTAKVIDENGVSIYGADVRISFEFPKREGIGLDTISIKGNTDKQGLFTGTGEGMASISISAIKEGYYMSGRGYEFTSLSKITTRWEPWNPTIEVVLQKKRNPVGMYQMYLEAVQVPIFDSPVGYDLEKGDWVAPYGSGVTGDLVFDCSNNYIDFRNAETSCEISFHNEKDGFQEYSFNEQDQSYYKWPFDAPENGYEIKVLKKWMSAHLPGEGYKSNYKENINYIFRVRTEIDKNGKVIKANYGKIKGDIRLSKKAQVQFFYYFNPDGTRNLEEDPEKNLFKKK